MSYIAWIPASAGMTVNSYDTQKQNPLRCTPQMRKQIRNYITGQSKGKKGKSQGIFLENSMLPPSLKLWRTSDSGYSMLVKEKGGGYLTKVTAMYGRNKLVRIILQVLTIPSKTRPMKKTQKKRRTIKDALIDWFTKPIDVKSIITTKAPVEVRDKARNKAEKTVYSKSTAKLKEKLKAESLARAEAQKKLKTEIKAREKAEASLEAESKKRQRLDAKAKKVIVEDEAEGEEKVHASAKEIKDCIELINKRSGGTAGKPNRDSEHADMDNIDSKAGRDARKYKATGGKDVDKGTKSSRQGASPAEMVMLVAKAEENISKAVSKAKEEDDKKAKGAK